MGLQLMDKFMMRGGVLLVGVLVVLTACTPWTGYKHGNEEETATNSTTEQPRRLNIDSLAAVISARHPAFNDDEEVDINDDGVDINGDEGYDDDLDGELDDADEDIYGFDDDLHPTVRRHATVSFYTWTGFLHSRHTVDADVYIQGGNIKKIDFPRGIGYPSGTSISGSRYDGAGHYRVYIYGNPFDVTVH